ncbi:protein EARLY FLOWERING 4-like [Cucurbita pepo subsp. pepo]|uniref:Protein EARLY FLOWERING 4-like n=1 Tax=Cucurbita moschata TaxID=3662 RepID=A0A6J1GYX8_CUCMO|nr:protein EARLY FLOWERING 4-like [Cucurbita moschata]XP_023534577.1 protein EARLY FLOWERING 4-like [Cucurbita pepo subsp. pepo]
MADINPRRKSKTKPSATTTTTTTTTTSDDGRHDGFPDECDAQVWASFDQTFRQVQSVLDRNRVLIQQVNENHQSRIPSNMVDNVALIQELNGNISKVVSMYSDFSSDFSSGFNNNKSRNGKRGSSNPDA